MKAMKIFMHFIFFTFLSLNALGGDNDLTNGFRLALGGLFSEVQRNTSGPRVKLPCSDCLDDQSKTQAPKRPSNRIFFINGYRAPSLYFGADTINDSLPSFMNLDGLYRIPNDKKVKGSKRKTVVPDDQLTHGLNYVIAFPIGDNIHVSFESLNLLFTDLDMMGLSNYKHQFFINEHQHKLMMRYFFDRPNGYGFGLLAGAGIHVMDAETESGFFNPALQQKWFHQNCKRCLEIINLSCEGRPGLCEKSGRNAIVVLGGSFTAERDLFQLRYLQGSIVSQSTATAEYSFLSERASVDLRTNNELVLNVGPRRNKGVAMVFSVNAGALLHSGGGLYDASLGGAMRFQFFGTEKTAHVLQFGYSQSFTAGQRFNYQLLNTDGNNKDNNRLGTVFVGYGYDF